VAGSRRWRAQLPPPDAALHTREPHHATRPRSKQACRWVDVAVGWMSGWLRAAGEHPPVLGAGARQGAVERTAPGPGVEEPSVKKEAPAAYSTRAEAGAPAHTTGLGWRNVATISTSASFRTVEVPPAHALLPAHALSPRAVSARERKLSLARAAWMAAGCCKKCRQLRARPARLLRRAAAPRGCWAAAGRQAAPARQLLLGCPPAYLLPTCAAMRSAASCTVVIFSAPAPQWGGGGRCEPGGEGRWVAGGGISARSNNQEQQLAARGACGTGGCERQGHQGAARGGRGPKAAAAAPPPLPRRRGA
jgi:hypothetical protein